MKVKTIYVKDAKKFNLDKFPNFDKNGSITGMKKLYYGRDCLLVRCASYIYNVSSQPDIYDAAH